MHASASVMKFIGPSLTPYEGAETMLRLWIDEVVEMGVPSPQILGTIA